MTITARGVDHIVVAGPDLGTADRYVRDRLHCEVAPGGQHLGWGTRNLLLDLGAGTYLEVIGPDPDQPAPDRPRPFDIDRLTGPALVAWAVRTPDIDAAVAELARSGIELGPVSHMTRAVPGGGEISWRLTPPRAGPLPFLIDWGSAPHPSTSLPDGPQLVHLRLEADDTSRLRRACRLLDVDVEVVASESVRLVASIRTGERVVELT